jgi:hypothetical protein
MMAQRKFPSFRIKERWFIVIMITIYPLFIHSGLFQRSTLTTADEENVITALLHNNANHNSSSSGEILSPVCHPYIPPNATIRRIHFLHMRKAAGTSIRNYFKKLAAVYNLTYIAHEAKMTEPPGSRNDTLYITHLREPNERSLSQFKYEHRWPCRQLVKNASFVATRSNAHSFSEWIASNFTCGRRILWACSHDCYVRWLNGCLDRRQILEEDPTQQFQQALSTLREYHLVLHMERLFDKTTDYAFQIENWFGVGGLLDSNETMFCYNESKKANREFPLVVTDVNEQTLRQLNQRDSILYDTLTTCPRGINVPSLKFYHHVEDGKERLERWQNVSGPLINSQ